jgi:Phage terminase, small subunit
MGARGPLPNPSARRRLKRGAETPVQLTVLPARGVQHGPPESLGPAVAKAWQFGWGLPWIAESDLPTIQAFAVASDRHAVICQALGEQGLTLSQPVQSAKGALLGEKLIAHPLLGELRRVEAALAKLRAELLASPQARARVGIALAASGRTITAEQEREELRLAREALA